MNKKVMKCEAFDRMLDATAFLAFIAESAIKVTAPIAMAVLTIALVAMALESSTTMRAALVVAGACAVLEAVAVIATPILWAAHDWMYERFLQHWEDATGVRPEPVEVA